MSMAIDPSPNGSELFPWFPPKIRFRIFKNWRPISLLNNDYKIASKAIAVRIESELPKIVHSSQQATSKEDVWARVSELLQISCLSPRRKIFPN